ncbi:DUF448 domain-containing protein [Thermaurantiacus sp.]
MRKTRHEAPAAGRLSPEAQPERRCVLTGAHGARAALIRLVIGPDGTVWPDPAARLPGRGAWVTADAALIERAVASGRLRAALARSFRGAPPRVPPDLARRIEAGLEARALERLGLERRAGRLLFGAERLAAEARAGRLALVLSAADAAADGVHKLEQALKAGGGAGEAIRLPASRERLSRALGRDNSVHLGIADTKAAARIRGEIIRWISLWRPAEAGLSDRGLPATTYEGQE